MATALLVREKRVPVAGDPHPAAFALLAAASVADDGFSIVRAAVREASVAAPRETCRLDEVAPTELEPERKRD